MNVLSLFGGIECSYNEFEANGIKVENYYSAEINEYPVSITRYNIPKVIELGDVTKVDFTKLGKIDVVIGGFPCTEISIAKKNREVSLQGKAGDMFRECLRALKETNPKYFIFENNNSIHKDIKDEIDALLGVRHIMINSANVSCQQRKRCYWTNIPNVTQPTDLGITMQDILEDEVDEKYYISLKGLDYIESKNMKGLKLPQDKIGTLTASMFKGVGNDGVTLVPICVNSKSGRGGIPDIQPSQQDRIYDISAKIPTVTSAFNPNIAVPIRLGHFNKGGQEDRVYSVVGKCITLAANGGGRGEKTGLYKIDLPNGDYRIRKLTPLECERAQTLPDNWTKYGINKKGEKVLLSDSQRLKAIGNGWTAKVFKHFYSFLPKE